MKYSNDDDRRSDEPGRRSTDGPPTQYEDGAYRFNATDKLRYDLFPAKAMKELAQVYTVGGHKYGDRNWEKGMSWMRMVAGLFRHTWLWIQGEDIDPDTGTHHMANAAWNALCLVEYYYTGHGQDDRPAYKDNK